MKYEDEKFIIYYNNCDKRYIDFLIEIIKSRLPMICDFFGINYDKKITIKFYDNLEEYKNNLQTSFVRQAKKESEREGKIIEPRKYQSWMIANTEDGNINMQSLDLIRTQEDYKDYSEEEFCYNACHEFTHLCQQYINSENPGWFWELIATTIGNPEVQHESNESFTIYDLNKRFDEIDGYGIVYKFGKYIFENYDRDTILSWIKDNNKFLNEIEVIIDDYNKFKIM